MGDSVVFQCLCSADTVRIIRCDICTKCYGIEVVIARNLLELLFTRYMQRDVNIALAAPNLLHPGGSALVTPGHACAGRYLTSVHRELRQTPSATTLPV